MALKLFYIFLTVSVWVFWPENAKAENRLFGCIIEKGSTLKEDGTIGPTSYTENVRLKYGELIFDEVSAILRGEHGFINEPLKMKVLQRGTASSDLLAVYELSGPSRYILWTLRIRTWEAERPFMFIKGAGIYSGRCRTR